MNTPTVAAATSATYHRLAQPVTPRRLIDTRLPNYLTIRDILLYFPLNFEISDLLGIAVKCSDETILKAINFAAGPTQQRNSDMLRSDIMKAVGQLAQERGNDFWDEMKDFIELRQGSDRHDMSD